MNWRAGILLVIGVVAVLLGGLWVLQGADVVRVRPILCVANCRPVTGGSTAWLAAGVIAVVAGLVALGAGTLQLHRRV